MRKLVVLYSILAMLYLLGNNRLAFAAASSKSNSIARESLSLINVESENNVSSTVPAINMNNLSSADNDTNDLLKLKRKLDIEKAQADIKKLHNQSISGNNHNSASRNAIADAENAQTTVTGVAINQDGKKIAWLQFADGGSLTVNIGSKVGKYIVSDITMTGVQLSYYSGRGNRKVQTLFLSRAYYAPEKPKNQQNQKNNTFFAPSPIVTNANTGSGEDMVPPIVSVR